MYRSCLKEAVPNALLRYDFMCCLNVYEVTSVQESGRSSLEHQQGKKRCGPGSGRFYTDHIDGHILSNARGSALSLYVTCVYGADADPLSFNLTGHTPFLLSSCERFARTIQKKS